MGSTWKGLFGATRTLAGGASVTADESYLSVSISVSVTAGESYLRESIEDPNAKIVQGFSANLMPATYGTALSDDDIAAIIEYIKTLK